MTIETTFEEAESEDPNFLFGPGRWRHPLSISRRRPRTSFPLLPIQRTFDQSLDETYTHHSSERLCSTCESSIESIQLTIYTDLPKACHDTIDLILTCPDGERIIQKNLDPGLKARFQHICEARVLSFDVDPIYWYRPDWASFFLLKISSIYDTISKSFHPFLSSALRPTKYGACRTIRYLSGHQRTPVSCIKNKLVPLRKSHI